jgi:hypothetical protein
LRVASGRQTKERPGQVSIQEEDTNASIHAVRANQSDL